MRSTHDPITRRDALARIAGGAALACSATSRGAVVEDEERPPARIFVTTRDKRGEVDPGLEGILAFDPKDRTWTQVVAAPFAFPRVAPDGRRLICNRQERGARGVWVCDIPGGEPRKLADEADGELTSGFWSPDGTQIVLSSPNPRLRKSRVVRVSPDGSGQVALPIPETDHVLDWSPDGRWFATKAFGPPIHLVHPDGTGRRLLFEEGVSGLSVRFSPDGRSIAYVRDETVGDRSRFRVETSDLDGQHRWTILEVSGRQEPFHLAWSPDGTELAVLTREDRREPGVLGRPNDFFFGIATLLDIVSVDGQRRRRLDVLDGVHLRLDDWR